MSFHEAANGSLPNGLIPSANAPEYAASKWPVEHIAIGTSSSAQSIMMPWKKSVQHTAL